MKIINLQSFCCTCPDGCAIFFLLPLLSQNFRSVEQIVTPPTETQGFARLAALKSLPSNSLPPELLRLWCVYCRRPFNSVFIKTWSWSDGMQWRAFFHRLQPWLYQSHSFILISMQNRSHLGCWCPAGGWVDFTLFGHSYCSLCSSEVTASVRLPAWKL